MNSLYVNFETKEKERKSTKEREKKYVCLTNPNDGFVLLKTVNRVINLLLNK